MSEFDLIRRIRQTILPHPQVSVGPGDDTAVIRPAGEGDLLLTTDMMIEGVHFDLSSASPERVGRKALAINLSDIAAMAGRPTAAVLSVALPRRGGTELGERLVAGMRQLAADFQLGIAGGDTNSWDGPLVISVTLLGQASAKGPVLRSGARPGDWVLVTGDLGGSLAGKHLEFVPRVREALLLHERYTLHAMIDLSDGLAGDLRHIVEESRCGAVLRKEAIPISSAAQASADDSSPFEHAMTDGEDFELCLAAPEADARRMLDEQPLGDVTLTAVGRIVAETELWWELPGGGREPLTLKGYEHRLD